MTDTSKQKAEIIYEPKKINYGALLNDDTVEWLAAMPLLVLSTIPLVVFVLRFAEENYATLQQFLDPVRVLFCLFAGITALVCIATAVRDKQKPSAIISGNKPFLLFAAFLLLMLISYLVVGKPFFDDPFNHLGINSSETHIMYIMFFTVYFFLGSRIRSPKIKGLIIHFNVLISFIIASFGLVDCYIAPLRPFRLTQIWDGCFPGVWSNPNHYGYYLTLMTLLSVGMLLYEKERSWKIFGLVSSAVHCVTMVLNDTFGSYLAIWFGFVFLIIVNIIIFRKFPLLLLIPAAVLLLASIFLPTWAGSMGQNFAALGQDTVSIVNNDENAGLAGSVRWTLWRTAAEGIMESPIFGQGLEGWADILLERSTTGIHPHNEYLQYALFFGIPAACCYIAGLVAVFLRGLFNRKKLDGLTLMCLAAAFGYCVSAFFGNPKFYTAPYFFMILGFAYNYCLAAKESTGSAKAADTGAEEAAAQENVANS